MYSAGFKPVTSAIERLQTYDLDHTATGISTSIFIAFINFKTPDA
jgi:hypothetical protein